MQKRIFITGASRGFGKLWTEAFLKRGDKVVATARDLSSLENLAKEYPNSFLPLQLDVTHREECFTSVKKAHEYLGVLDVVINCAGYGLFGSVEETSDEDTRNLMETNFFGLVWVTKAALPILRKQGKGHIIQVSSLLGLNPMPLMGMYSASKSAMEAFSETLAMEIKDFGIKVTIVEPNGYNTEFTSVSAIHTQPMEEYAALKKAVFSGFKDDMLGVPEATVKAICKLIDAPKPPLRFFLGKHGLPVVTQTYQDRLTTWEEWKEISFEAHGK
ncbi:MAG: SDR family NAD(P)-dependent oxidoreductase [Bacteroidota bacterium]